MKSKTMILMVVAVVCGLAASYMTSRLLAERGNDKPVDEEKVTVLVARRNLPQGVWIKDPEKDFVEKEFVKGQEPKKAARSFEEVKDRLLIKPLNAEQWVSVDDLMTKDRGGLQAALPKGMRAIAIKVNIDTIVAGFVLPNSRVDILQTVRHDKDSFTQTILQNMLVLAVDQLPNRDPDKQTILGNTVTLAVTPEDAQKLRVAQACGDLTLVLRPLEDNDLVNIKATKPEDVRSGKHQLAQAGDEDAGPPLPLKVPDVPKPSPAPEKQDPEPVVKPPKKHTLTVINGDSITRAVFLDRGEDEPETLIEKSDPEPRPGQAAPAPAAGKAAPGPEQAPPAPAPEAPKPAAKPQGRGK